MTIIRLYTLKPNLASHVYSGLVLLVCFCLLLSSRSLYADHSGTDNTYIVGVVPQFEARRLHAIWRPILDQLEKKTGYTFDLQGSPSIPDFEKEFLAGKFDFAYMNPYHLVWSQESSRYLPLIRDHSKQLQGVLVVNNNSKINDVTELDGKIVTFPAPNALGASLLIRADLEDIFKIKIIPRYVKTHDSVYLNVALNQAAAGGGVQKTLNRQQKQVKDSLKVLYRTRKVAPHPFASHPRIDPEISKRLQDALLEIASTEEGKQMLARIPIKQIGTASMGDYLPLNKMGLERFRQED
ncbi:MAG: phosphate/phosphite/phosphonate ABC transporter substrate-binding protein [Gammaproteobacteria bacterium]|nr:phosphate/phosphite/phosphonate ABC transporter substrate-binding protein [Gammaproteobacteria bacterium]